MEQPGPLSVKRADWRRIFVKIILRKKFSPLDDLNGTHHIAFPISMRFNLRLESYV